MIENGKMKAKNVDLIDEIVVQAKEDLPLVLKSDSKNEKLIKFSKKLDIFFDQLQFKKATMKQKEELIESGPVSEQNASHLETPTTCLNKNLKEKIEKQTAFISELVFNDVLKNKTTPQNSSQFETELSSFKDNHFYIMEYLAKMNEGYILKFYSKRQLEFKYFEKILNAFPHFLDQKDNERHLKVMSNFLKQFVGSFGYKLVLKMCLRKEKTILKNVLSKCKVVFEEDRNELCKLENEVI